MTNTDSQPRIVTPQEAQTEYATWEGWERAGLIGVELQYVHVLYTVATEPGRARAAVVKVLRDTQHEYGRKADMADDITGRTLALAFADVFRKRADAIENGTDYA